MAKYAKNINVTSKAADQPIMILTLLYHAEKATSSWLWLMILIRS